MQTTVELVEWSKEALHYCGSSECCSWFGWAASVKTAVIFYACEAGCQRIGSNFDYAVCLPIKPPGLIVA